MRRCDRDGVTGAIMVQDHAAVLLDSNIWLGERLLRSVRGASLLALIHGRGWRIVLPQVVEEEVVNAVRGKVETLITSIADQHRELVSWVGEAEELDVSAVGADTAAQRRFAELDGLLTRVPLTPDHHARAMELLMSRLPPNTGSREAYKDSLVWQVAVEASDQLPLFFVSNDKGFFQSDNNLHGNLKEDAGRQGIVAYQSLAALLDATGATSELFDETEVSPLLYEALRSELLRMFPDSELWVGDELDHRITGYLTAEAGVLTVDFSFQLRGSFDLPRIFERVADAAEPFDGTIEVEGSASFRLAPRTIERVQFDRLGFTTDMAGTPVTRSILFSGGVTIHIGRRPPQRFALKAPL